ncbi:hypothetical protein ACTFR8_22000 [Bacillus cereus group sp. MYBK15-3]|uniref:hypothetical protein n=1 Tax=unclassified Bacillus cereus group TaxID=2750818 RepID=UPI003F79E05C
MGRLSFSGARTGRRAGGNGLGNMVQRLSFEIGETKRIIFPVLPDSEGNMGLVVLAEPFHPIKQSFLNFVNSRGGTYQSYQVRCMHPYSQTDRNEAVKSAERKEMCPFCELSQYEVRRTYAEMEERYGEDGFKELSKDEQKKFYEEMDKQRKVENSYYKKSDEDGNEYNVTRLDITLLALELELEDAVGKNNKPVKRVVRDENGMPKYKKILMTMSQNRLDKFKTAADNAFEQGILDEDVNAYGYIENEGTEHEEEVLIGFVDFAVKFPNKPTKMESAKDMSPVAVPAKNSVVTKEFVDAITEIGVKLVAEAEKSYKAINPTLRPHTPQEAIALMADGGEYFYSMREQFGREEEDTEFNEKVFATVLSGAGAGTDEDAEAEANALREEDEAQEAAAAKAKTVKTEKKAEAKKVETKKEEPEDNGEVEDDDNFDEFMGDDE